MRWRDEGGHENVSAIENRAGGRRFGLAAQAPAQNQPLEPTALPPAVEQGVDMVYVDKEIAGNIRWRNTKLDNVTFARYAGAPLNLLQAINPLYTELRRGLVHYQRQWSSLPQFRLDPGPALGLGADGPRVTLLRERLLSMGRLTGQSPLYQWMNVVGAAGFTVNGWWHGALPSAALNVIWMMIGGVALWRIVAKRKAARGSSTSAM